MSTLYASHGTKQRSSYPYSFKSIKHITAAQDNKWIFNFILACQFLKRRDTIELNRLKRRQLCPRKVKTLHRVHGQAGQPFQHTIAPVSLFG